MEFRQLTKDDIEQLQNLIADMYTHLTNLEHIPPILFDRLHLMNMLNMSRFYFLGAFEGEKLVGFASLDFRSTNSLDLLKLPEEYNPQLMVKLDYTMVKFEYRRQGIMKKLLEELKQFVLKQGYKIVFAETYKYNFPAMRSFLHSGYETMYNFDKEIDMNDFKIILEQDCIASDVKKLAEMTLGRFTGREKISLPYVLLAKPIKES